MGEKVAAVARVYKSLTPEEQVECIIFVGNYGEAGAIDFWGAKYGLPGAICTHMTYYYWGPGERSGRTAIVYNMPIERLKPLFESIQQVETIEHPNVNKYENHLPVYLCKGGKTTIQEVWKQVKPRGF